MMRDEMRDKLRIMWLMLRIVARIVRVQFPCRRLTFIWHKHRSLKDWREMRELFRKHGYELPILDAHNG